MEWSKLGRGDDSILPRNEIDLVVIATTTKILFCGETRRGTRMILTANENTHKSTHPRTSYTLLHHHLILYARNSKDQSRVPELQLIDPTWRLLLIVVSFYRRINRNPDGIQQRFFFVDAGGEFSTPKWIVYPVWYLPLQN